MGSCLSSQNDQPPPSNQQQLKNHHNNIMLNPNMYPNGYPMHMNPPMISNQQLIPHPVYNALSIPIPQPKKRMLLTFIMYN